VAFLLAVSNERKYLVGNNDDPAVTDCDLSQSVQQYAEVTIDRTKLVLCHDPCRTGDVGVDVWVFLSVRFSDVLGKRRGNHTRTTRAVAASARPTGVTQQVATTHTDRSAVCRRLMKPGSYFRFGMMYATP
jgi:hypothetical protein